MNADAVEALWARAAATAAATDRTALARAADCLALTLVEAAVSARMPERLRVATALARGGGPCTVAGLGRPTSVADAVVANGYLVHADLADDAYRVAAHPGIPVVPSALAHAQEAAADGETLLRAVLGGYELACTLADVFLPRIADRGWRVTAALAPPASAAAGALVCGLDGGGAVGALRLALGAAGGPLGVVAPGSDSWQLQPALLAGAGVAALRAAAAGLRAGAGMLEGAHGAHMLLTGETWTTPDLERPPRILDVAFKQYPVAMYGQAIFDACARAPQLEGAARRVQVAVAPFAAGYGRQGGTPSSSVASVAGIALQALAAHQPLVQPPAPEAIAVRGDETLAPLEARIEIELDDGVAVLAGIGDTSGWTPAEVEAHAVARAGEPARALHDACHALADGGEVEAVLCAWVALTNSDVR